MTILVTGAAGFIGGHLLRALTAFDDVSHGRLEEPIVALDLLPTTVKDHIIVPVQADIRLGNELALVGDKLKEHRFTACVHLAAIASPPIAQRDPATAWATNVQGTHNVLQLCHRLGIPRVVFMSSAHVYGISPKYMPTDEQHPLAMLDEYTATKVMGEQLCEQYYRHHGLSYCTLRLWNAYGPGQSKDYFIGAKLRQAGEGKLTLRNEHVSKDWIAVSDVVRAIQSAITSRFVGPINIGTGVETTLGTIAQRISDAYGVPIERENVPDEGPTRMCADWRRAKRVLDWAPQVTFADGLAELIELAREESA